MAKFFNSKKQKPKNIGNGLHTVSSDETARLDKMRISKEDVVAAMRAMGKSEEDIKKAYPDSLPQAEQDRILFELRQLFGSRKYKEVINKFLPIVNSGALTADVLDEACFAIGFSAVNIRDSENIKRFASHAAYFFMRQAADIGVETAVEMIVRVMQMAEGEVPGCMQEPARRLYPVLAHVYSEGHPNIEIVARYM